jgi:hypothetical protein
MQNTSCKPTFWDALNSHLWIWRVLELMLLIAADRTEIPQKEAAETRQHLAAVDAHSAEIVQ